MSFAWSRCLLTARWTGPKSSCELKCFPLLMTDSLLQGISHLVTLRTGDTISISPCLAYILPRSKFKKKNKKKCFCHIISISAVKVRVCPSLLTVCFRLLFAPLVVVLSRFLCAAKIQIFFGWSKTSAEEVWRIKSGWIFMAAALRSIQLQISFKPVYRHARL